MKSKNNKIEITKLEAIEIFLILSNARLKLSGKYKTSANKYWMKLEKILGLNTSVNSFTNSQLPKVEKSVLDVQGKREDAPNNQNGDGVITKVVDSSSHLPQSSSADTLTGSDGETK